MVKVLTSKLLDLEYMVQLDTGNALLNLGNMCFDHFDNVYNIKSTS